MFLESGDHFGKLVSQVHKPRSQHCHPIISPQQAFQPHRRLACLVGFLVDGRMPEALEDSDHAEHRTVDLQQGAGPLLMVKGKLWGCRLTCLTCLTGRDFGTIDNKKVYKTTLICF